MAQENEKPFWTLALMTDVLEAMERNGVDTDNLQDVWLILNCLITATLRSAVMLGMKIEHADGLLDELVKNQKRLVRDPNQLPLGKHIEL